MLALDPSAGVTGWAFFDGESICNAGWKGFSKTEFFGDSYLEATTWLKEMISIWKPDMVLIEGYYFSRRFATGTSVNSEFRGCLKMAIRQLGKPYKVIGPSEWKKKLMGRSSPSKSEKKKYGKTKAKKVITYNYLCEIGFSFPEKVVNERTGREVNFKYDITDAIGIMIAYLRDNHLHFKVTRDILGV